jgi:hypothetical protein
MPPPAVIPVPGPRPKKSPILLAVLVVVLVVIALVAFVALRYVMVANLGPANPTRTVTLEAGMWSQGVLNVTITATEGMSSTPLGSIKFFIGGAEFGAPAFNGYSGDTQNLRGFNVTVTFIDRTTGGGNGVLPGDNITIEVNPADVPRLATAYFSLTSIGGAPLGSVLIP